MEVTAAVLAVVVNPRSRTSALASPALIEARLGLRLAGILLVFN